MLSLERAHSPRRAGVWSLVGLLLVPLVIAGGFLLATWRSTDRLDRVQAAVVNLDAPVKLNGQTVPLGRQLAGGLVNGKDEDANFSWLLTDAADAASGLDSGRYAAVVTIPKNFSARATSYAKNDDSAAQARLGVQTSQVSGLSDPVVGQAITAAATKALNTQLTEAYLTNIYVGFNQTGKQFTTVADAAGKLSDGTTQLAHGLDQTAGGTSKLTDGLGQLSTGTRQLATGVQAYSDGVDSFADGADRLADGTGQSAAGAKKFSAGITRAVHTFRYGSQAKPGGTVAYADGVAQFATGLQTYQKQVVALAADPAALQKAGVRCPVDDQAQCALFYGGVQAGAGLGLAGFENTKDATGKAVPGLIPSAKKLAAGAEGIDGGLQALADPRKQSLVSGANQLAAGLDKLAGGTGQLANGAHKLATGADQLSTGAAKLADGTRQSARGAQQLSAGVTKLADGGDKLADGTTKLADGLAKGAKQIPSYDTETRQKLSEVVTTPVTTPKVTGVFSDVATTTLLVVLALWVGGLVSFLVLRAVSGRVLASMQPSWRLALGALLPGAAIAAAQSVALTVLTQSLLKLDPSRLGQLLGFALLVALSFVAINQALVAWFGGVGRFLSVLLVVLTAAGALTSAVPEVFDAIAPGLPLTPALAGLRAIVTGAGGVGGSVGLLLAWLVLGLAAGILAVARRRVVAPLVAVAV